MNARELITLMLVWNYHNLPAKERSAPLTVIQNATLGKFTAEQLTAALDELVKAGHVRVRYELTDAGKEAMERTR
jgi:hypothetical protein